MPRTSFLIPVRNGARFVVDAIQSALAQTDADHEVVVVDDHSADGTRRLVDNVCREDDRVRLLSLEGGSGLVDALNFGLAHLHGAFVARLDADDLAMPDRLSRQRSFLEAHPGVALIGSALEIVDPAGLAVGLVEQPAEPERVSARLLEGNVIAHSSVLARRESLEQAGGYRSAFVHAEDYDLWLRIADAHSVANLPEPLTRYRIHPAQVSDQHVEAQAVSALAARVVARIRRQTGAEPTIPESVDAVFLYDLGIPADEIDETIVRAALEWSSLIELVDRRRAAAILASASRRVGERSHRAEPLDRRRARLALRSRRPQDAVAPLVRLARRRWS